MKAKVTVVARVRPLSGVEKPCGLISPAGSMVVRVPLRAQGSTSTTGSVLSRDELRDFSLDGVLGAGCSQEECFTATTAPLVASLVDGYNGTIMAYGQTGAGKSFTLFGPSTDGGSIGGDDGYAERGLCARAIRAVFREVSRRGLRDRATVSVSALEIYNEAVFDVLAPARLSNRPRRWETTQAQHVGDPLSRRRSTLGATGGAGGEGDDMGEPLTVWEDGEGVAAVKGLRVVECAGEDDASALLSSAAASRTLASHALNSRSSRAHFVFTLYLTVRGKDSDGQGEAWDSSCVASKLHLVDLAGSERGDRTAATGLVAREASFINKSLSALEQVVLALAVDASPKGLVSMLDLAPSEPLGATHVPFRRSKLTHLLKDSLGGNCRTSLVACVWPACEHLDQTLATLKFAVRMRCVETRPVVNRLHHGISFGAVSGAGGGGAGGSTLGDIVEVERLRKQVAALRAELVMHDAVAGLSLTRPELQVAGTSSASEATAFGHGLSEDERARFVASLGRFALDKGASPPLLPSWQCVLLALDVLRDVCHQRHPAPAPTTSDAHTPRHEDKRLTPLVAAVLAVTGYSGGEASGPSSRCPSPSRGMPWSPNIGGCGASFAWPTMAGAQSPAVQKSGTGITPGALSEPVAEAADKGDAVTPSAPQRRHSRPDVDQSRGSLLQSNEDTVDHRPWKESPGADGTTNGDKVRGGTPNTPHERSVASPSGLKQERPLSSARLRSRPGTADSAGTSSSSIPAAPVPAPESGNKGGTPNPLSSKKSLPSTQAPPPASYPVYAASSEAGAFRASTQGGAAEAALSAAKVRAKDAKAAAKGCAQAVNAAKARIDACSAHVEVLAAALEACEVAVAEAAARHAAVASLELTGKALDVELTHELTGMDAEAAGEAVAQCAEAADAARDELRRCKDDVKEAKRAYRAAFGALEASREEAEVAAMGKDLAVAELAAQFEAWKAGR